MTTLFMIIFNMSIKASYVALGIIAVRMLLKKSPKIFSYILWLPLLIRLVFPISFSSTFSFLNLIGPKSQIHADPIEYIPSNISLANNPMVNVGIDKVNNAVNSSLPVATPMASINPMQIIIEIASRIWVVGIALLFIYSIISYFKLRNKVKTATIIKDNIFETDQISAPFVCGLIKPRIYIPTNLEEHELPYILTHEQIHIKRLDYLVKPFAFLALILHWFNPLLWFSFILMSKDMEMSCDERVLKGMGNDVKGNYSNSLLSLSVKQSGLILGNSLNFGNSNIKSRIKNILTYKRPGFWSILATIIITILSTISLTANPKNSQLPKLPDLFKTPQQTDYLGYNTNALMNNKTQYVGDNSKVLALIDAMPLPIGITRASLELQTTNVPYGIRINLILDDMNESLNITQRGFVGDDIFYPNSILLLSLIDNIDFISYAAEDNTGEYKAFYHFTHTREMAEKLIGRDVRPYTDNIESLEGFINQLTYMSFDINADKREAKNHKIEEYLAIIMSLPNTSSTPQDYIKAYENTDEYQHILKFGDEALNYLLAEFQQGDNNNLRGHIMMALCKELLGPKNNITDESLLPQDWFSKLSPYVEIALPDFQANVSDFIEQLVYDTAINQYSLKNSLPPYMRTDLVYDTNIGKYSVNGHFKGNFANDGFTVVAPTILGSYEEESKLKVFATIYSTRYKLYDKTLSEVGGSVIPVAITFSKNNDGTYTLEEFLEPMDGTYWAKSIKAYCIMPVSKKEIKGLSDKIQDDYGDNEKRSELLRENLIKHLKVNNQEGIILKDVTGEMIPLT